MNKRQTAPASLVFDGRTYKRFSVRGYPNIQDANNRADKMRKGGGYYARVQEISGIGTNKYHVYVSDRQRYPHGYKVLGTQ